MMIPASSSVSQMMLKHDASLTVRFPADLWVGPHVSSLTAICLRLRHTLPVCVMRKHS